MIDRLKNPKNKTARFYDNGGETADRYTAVYIRPENIRGERCYSYVGMSAEPFHPQGFGQHGESRNRPIDFPVVGLGKKSHLGKRIRFQDLPADCQKLVLRDLGA